MFIILTGPPGSGKGTQSQRLTQRLGVPHLSTGDLLRAAKAAGTELGKTAASYMDHGHLVPDALVVELVKERLSAPDCENGCLFDGFPRTIEQAEILGSYLAQRGQQVDAVIALDVPKQVLTERIAGRAKTEGARTDDAGATVARRLEVYQSQTKPLLEYYSRRGVMTLIDGTGTVDEVFRRILAALPGDGDS